MRKRLPGLLRHDAGFIADCEEPRTYGDGRWVTSVQCGEAVYLHGGRKSLDGGVTWVDHDDPLPEDLLARPEGGAFYKPGFFLGLDKQISFFSPGRYRVRTWRSTDDLKTVQEGEAEVHVPEGPARPRRQGEWFGLYLHRSIVELPDGALLATVEGNFADDTIVPTDYRSKRETKYKQRSAVLRSEDQGETWHYLSTIARPRAEDPVGEGFDEPTMVRLDDGRLFCVMRTGHYSPLYSSWSSDEGRTWTAPLYTGLERGCDPCLLKLRDGRLLLSYGKRFPEGWSRIGPEEDRPLWVQPNYPAKSLVKFALSPEGTGEEWTEATVACEMGSGYSTILEVEPNVVLCQVDGWIWRTRLNSR